MKYGAYWPSAAARWDHMKIRPEREAEVQHAAERIISNKAIYQRIEAATGVPWSLVAALHMRESSCNFKTYLGNGEPLNRTTRLVPRGRGPFPSFEAGAIDALRYDGLASLKDWRIEKQLWAAESFNGWGYANRGLPSPYVFGATSVQRPGKYVADGKWNPRAWDTQIGVAPLLQMIAKLDPSVTFTRED